MKSTPLKSLISRTIWVLTAFLLAACAVTAPTITDEKQLSIQPPTAVPAAFCPAPAPVSTPAAKLVIPNLDAWTSSPHNAVDTEAFNHWNDTEDKSVPVACATCHSTTGYQDFLGADGSEAGKVDQPAPIGTTIECIACHNDQAAALSSVTFPSGVVVNDLGPEARCMVCHAGFASKKTVDDLIAKFNGTDVDTPVEPLKDGDKVTNFGFVNVHYFAAAATLYAGQVEGGYQYKSKIYDSKNQHTPGYDTCVGCHDQHSLQVKVDQCAMCHEGVTTVKDLKKIRMISSSSDYDGDGNVTEGMSEEIAGLQEPLMTAIQAYAKDVAGAGIVYDPAVYPYFMLDKVGDGKPDQDDKGANIAYNAWTARLLKAAYNYQVSVKDPGAFAHGNKYIVQLLFDSIEDLNTKLATPIDMSAMNREDAGHFAGNTEAFRHWDAENYTVPGTCAKCHTSTGLPQFIHEGAVISNPSANGFLCSTCHDEANWPARYAVTSVPFPSGAVLTFSTEKDADGNLIPVDSNLCIECHQGRESTVSMDKALAAFKDAQDTPDAKIRFRNVHYFAAGATLFGSEAKGIYQYNGKTYNGRFMHEGTLNTCTDCHDAHTQKVKVDACEGCHKTTDPTTIRMNSKEDYDGDGDTTEGLSGELVTFQKKLYAAIQAYATKAGTGIVYVPTAYPYFFVDKDADGKPDKDDKGANIGYNAWTLRLLKAAYNYQYSQKDPGAYTHNFKYVAQALYDSIADLKGDLAGMKRPE